MAKCQHCEKKEQQIKKLELKILILHRELLKFEKDSGAIPLKERV